MSSISYVFWNIKVTGKCALIVDMATTYSDVPRDPDSEFGQMRDAFYILAVMNQFQIKSRMPSIPAEKLLRIALFSDSLKLSTHFSGAQSLPKRRKELAYDLRRNRRRGIVPVFIALGWFLFSLGISIQSAFGEIGQNATAHNLALGLMLGWLPVFVLASIIDRNPMSSDDIRLRLNALLDKVRLALLNPELRDTYMRDTGRRPDDFAWTEALADHDYFSASFFSDFAGQGRTRWHYGVAHPILAGIEDAYVAEYGRDWLRDTEAARTAMVLGPRRLTGLRWFDLREIWQVLSAITVVVATLMGAFIISFFTPTVGLGCRSGGYMIFGVIAFASLVIELLVWWQVSTEFARSPTFLRHASIGDPITNLGNRLERKLSRAVTDSWQETLHTKTERLIRHWDDMPFRSKVDVLVLKPFDIINTCWLIYITNAQTFGWYRSCKCMSSIWAGGGGYIDFQSIDSYKARGIAYYWGAGAGLAMTVLFTATAFIIAEWCTQSHLSTENYQSARRGLQMTRIWKRHTTWVRVVPNAIIEGIVHLRWVLLKSIGKRGSVRPGRRSLIWSSKIRPRHRAPSVVVHGVAIPNDPEEELDLLARGRPRTRDEAVSMRSMSAVSPGHVSASPHRSSHDGDSYRGKPTIPATLKDFD